MKILSRVFALVVLASGCSPQMNYRAPRGWLDRRLPAGRPADWVPPAAAPVTDPQVEAISRQRAAAYQIAVCENIAAGYSELATTRRGSDFALTLTGAILSAVGAGFSAASAAVPDGSVSERNLLTTGVTVGFAGATITAINGLIGGRADGYTDAATSLRTSIGTFRDYLRSSELGARHLEPVGVGAPAAPGPPAGEAPGDTARSAAIEARVRFAALRVFDDELCALRDACFRRQIDAIPVGRAFLAETSPTEADAARSYIDTHCGLRPDLGP